MTAWVGAACLHNKTVVCQNIHLERLHAAKEALMKRKRRETVLFSDHGGQLRARRLLCADRIRICFRFQDEATMRFQQHDSNVQMLVMHKAHDALHHMRDFTVACESFWPMRYTLSACNAVHALRCLFR